MRILLVVGLLLSMGLAGCSSPETTVPVPPPQVLDSLSTPLYEVLPVEEMFVTASDGKRMHNAVYRPDTNGSVPVFINFSPYWGNTAETGGDGFGQWLLEHLVPRGYAVVLSAVRGTGHSEGCFEVASDREVQDLYEVVDHFANEPWSNGAIAAGGKSYDSTTQNGMIAKMPHDALKGIFHVSGITDMYRYNYVNGVPYMNGLTFTPRYAQTYGSDGSHPDGEPFGAIDAHGCTEMAEHVLSGTGSAATGLKDAYWQERDWTQFIGDSEWNGSIFFVHGFQDWNVKPDHILPWITELPEAIRVKGWLHQDTENSGHVYPMRDDWNLTMIAWLDTELKGKNVGFWAAPAWDVEATDGLWRHMDAWPPEQVTLDAPFNTITASALSSAVAHVDLSTISNETIRISGAIGMDVQVAVINPDPVIVATVKLNGEWVGEAVLRAIYADGLEAPTPAVPGFPETFTLETYPLDIVVAPGDELVIEIGGGARFSIVTPAQQAGYVPETLVLHLPVASADAREDQPRATSCFAC